MEKGKLSCNMAKLISDGASYRKYSETPLTTLVTTSLSPEDHWFQNVYLSWSVHMCKKRY